MIGMGKTIVLGIYQVVPLFSREKGTGRGDEPLTYILNKSVRGGGGSPVTSYMAVPYYMTNKLQSLYLLNTEYVVLDVGATLPGIMRVKVNSTSARVHVIQVGCLHRRLSLESAIPRSFTRRLVRNCGHQSRPRLHSPIYHHWYVRPPATWASSKSTLNIRVE